MKDPVLQQLSEWMDGELDAHQVRLLRLRVQNDPELAAAWQRYHMIGEALKDRLPEKIDLNMAQRVQRALQNESIQQPEPIENKRRLWSALAGVVVLAGIMTITGLQLLQPPHQGSIDHAQVQSVAAESQLTVAATTSQPEAVVANGFKTSTPAIQTLVLQHQSQVMAVSANDPGSFVRLMNTIGEVYSE